MQRVNPAIDFSFFRIRLFLFSLFIGFITGTRTSHRRWCNLWNYRTNVLRYEVNAARIMDIFLSSFFTFVHQQWKLQMWFFLSMDQKFFFSYDRIHLLTSIALFGPYAIAETCERIFLREKNKVIGIKMWERKEFVGCRWDCCFFFFVFFIRCT